jgi:microcystin-dependent protein
MKFAYLTAALALLAIPSAEALAGADPFLGEVTMLATNFCPYGTVPATGQLLSIQQNAALFSLLGTMYGGDGKTNFALPNIPTPKTVSGQPLVYCIAITGLYPQKHEMRTKHPAAKE